MRASGRYLRVLPALAAAALVPWTVGIATSLPHSTVARHWNTAWAGLDILITLGLAVTAWLGRRRDRRVAVPATATATLMLADAWFDVCTSAAGPPFAAALVEAAIELSVAAACLLIAFRAGGRWAGAGENRAGA